MKPRHLDPTVADEGLVSTLRRISWGAVLAGVAVALVTQIALTMLGLAIGLGTYDPARDAQLFEGGGLGTGIWFVASTLVAVFTGGWVAGRLSGQPRNVDGSLHGITTWAVVTLASLFLITTTVGNVVGGALSLVGQGLDITQPATVESTLRQTGQQLEQAMQQADQQAAAEDATRVISTAATWTFVSMLLGAAVAAIGGAIGSPKDQVLPPHTRGRRPHDEAPA